MTMPINAKYGSICRQARMDDLQIQSIPAADKAAEAWAEARYSVGVTLARYSDSDCVVAKTKTGNSFKFQADGTYVQIN